MGNGEIGPTGKFPHGKLGPDDEGGLNIGIAIDETNGRVVVDFGKLIEWIGMLPDDAIKIGNSLISKANKIKEKK